MHKAFKNLIIGILLMPCVPLCGGCSENRMVYSLETAGETTQEAVASEEDMNSESLTGETEPLNSDTEDTKQQQICVFVCGQVANPGVYYLDNGARIFEAVEAAGGCLDTANICAVNQAEPLSDGRMIYIPSIGEEVMSTEGELVEDGLVHLNQATKEELMTLPGIGEAKAEAIVEYRRIHGGFSTKEELMNIPGIKEGVFLKIQDYITVE